MKRSNSLFTIVFCFILLTGSISGMVSASENAPSGMSNEPPQECNSAYNVLDNGYDSGSTVTVSATAPKTGVVKLNYSVPSSVDTFSVSLSDTHDVRASQGFNESHSGFYEYNGSGRATIVYAVNRSEYIPNFGTEEQRLSTFTAGDSDFATSKIPDHDEASFQLQFPEGGFAGTSVMYIGAVDRVLTIRHGVHSLKIVIPEAANESAVNRSITGIKLGMQKLDPQHYYCESVLIFHPENVRGYSNSADGVSGDEWIKRQPGTHTPLHEYIHTQQRYRLAGEMEWFTEASATYLTARILFDNGELTPAEYDALLTAFYRYEYATNLSNPNSFNDTRVMTDYYKGGLILAQLDEDLRQNGNSTIYDLFEAVGDSDGDSKYNLSDFHNDYNRLGGNRSEQELRTLVSDPGTTVEPPYVTESAVFLPNSMVRGPEYTNRPPKEVEVYKFKRLSILFGPLLLAIFLILLLEEFR